jgi:hypothetical protein
VAAALVGKTIHLHGWVYKFETGEVFHYDSDIGQFTRLQAPRADSRAPLPDGKKKRNARVNHAPKPPRRRKAKSV